MGFLSSLFGRSRPACVEGGLYCTRNEDGSYSVLKILKIDDRGFHVRTYSNKFANHPDKIDEPTLYMVPIKRNPNERIGIGHLPVSKKTFEIWNATFVQQSAVSEEELEGYKEWFDANGGYW